MKIGNNSAPLRQLRLSSYADGSLANVCWTPVTTDCIADKVGPHVHSFYEIVLIESGEGSHVVNGNRIAVRAGDLFLLGPGTSHDPVLLQGAVIWVFIFNLRALEFERWEGAIFTSKAKSLDIAHVILRDLHATETGYLRFRIPAADRRTFSSLLGRIELENKGKRAGWDKVIKSTLELLLIELHRQRRTPATRPDRQRHPVVAIAMDFIDANFHRAIGLTDVARDVGRSPAYLTDLVSASTGRPLMAWLRDRRLVEARNLILTTARSIEDVAASVGYGDPGHFSQLFKRQFGTSPASLRAHGGK